MMMEREAGGSAGARISRRFMHSFGVILILVVYSSKPIMSPLNIDPNIKRATTLPASFYRDSHVFESLREKVFARSWQWIGQESQVSLSESVYPLTLLDGYLDEPLLLTKDSDEQVRCLSNVCTHRGALLCMNPGRAKKLVCQYHGRRFALDGQFEHMPEFGEAENFPRDCDNLPALELRKWFGFLFTSLAPAFDFQQVIDVMLERVGFLDHTKLRFAPEFSRDYLVNSHWALYCDNYLEGFHIPFVHKDLNAVLDYGTYKTVVYDHCNLQIGYGKPGSDCFELPEGHPDSGKIVSAWYYWVFPNMMFNFYPWGLSVNIVKPLSIGRTKVSFLTYILDEERYKQGADVMTDKVEREDEFVVEAVQKGIRSRFYPGGRFSPTREKGVHHFHSLLAKFVENT
ncbi:aromatic ring-hydroxylating dioxygenase subunit alpha [uncultured Imperialibacter sp.]|uniref:aromatic ring-hydroxylating oxygenase subunit alpha n=1 Tax=uncultured Imperialibacter sp. TaxID=1672639 RepID=UPI0030DD1DE6|tara:strand:+ start:35051 stop:36250 length:1200 start_codon:yes stop_codon:yes gene_type:complete